MRATRASIRSSSCPWFAANSLEADLRPAAPPSSPVRHIVRPARGLPHKLSTRFGIVVGNCAALPWLFRLTQAMHEGNVENRGDVSDTPRVYFIGADDGG